MPLNIVVDVEADGPYPGDYSMVCFGAVPLEDLSKEYYGQLRPLQNNYSGSWAGFIPEALAISGFDRNQHLSFRNPAIVMQEFSEWLNVLKDTYKEDRIVLWSDNLAFDWQFINHYFHRFLGVNPFGHSARRIGDLWAGHRRIFADHTSWKKLRDTVHTHNPIDDARGNAEALLKIIKAM